MWNIQDFMRKPFLNLIKLNSQDFLAVCLADCEAKRLTFHLQHIAQRPAVVVPDAFNMLMGNFKPLLLPVVNLHTGNRTWDSIQSMDPDSSLW